MAGILRGCVRALTYEPERPTKRNELPARWAVMMFLCVGLFGSYYVYDIPAATETALSSAFTAGSQTDGNSTDNCVNGTATNTGSDADATAFNNNFNLLYSVYSWPNIILPFFGGYISDRLGVKLMGVVFIGLMTIGQIIVALGSSYISVNPTAAWYTMWIGRTVFGLGGESLSVAQSALIAAYFQGKELAFALGVNLALARVGSVVNNVLSAVIASNVDVSWAFWTGAGIMVAATLSMMYVYHLDSQVDAKLRKAAGKPPIKTPGLFRDLFCCVACRRHAALTKRADPESRALTSAVDEDPDDDVAAPSEEIRLDAVFRFPFVFWALTFSCLTVYIDVLTFNNNAADFVTQKYLTTKPTWQMCDADRNAIYLTANSIMSITYLVAGFLSPFFGTLCDRIGLRAALNLFAAAAIMSVHIVLSMTNFYPAVPLVALGLCYSIYASALWPSIAIVIEPAYQATAYGLVTAVQNMGQAVSPLVVATLMPDPHCTPKSACVSGWESTELFFVYMGAVGVVCGVLLNVCDHCISKYPYLNYTETKVNELRRAAGETIVDDAAPKHKNSDGLEVDETLSSRGSINDMPTTPLMFGGPAARHDIKDSNL